MKRSYQIQLDLGGMNWDSTVFDRTMDAAAEGGLDTVLLLFTGGVEFASHPEITAPGALTKAAAKEVIRGIRERGIRIIPGLNFSTAHWGWTGDWKYRMCSPEYYTFCSDIIKETAEYCDGPEIIHLGLDEESYRELRYWDYYVLRNGERKWDDYRFYMNCCREAGARPAAWADIYWLDPVNCVKNISKDMILYPWYYGAVKHENMLTSAQWEAWVREHLPTSVAANLRYWKNEDLLELQRRALTECAAAGYDVVPCASTFYGCDCNTAQIMERCSRECDPDRVLGYLTAPWIGVTEGTSPVLLKSVELLRAGKEEFYPED